MQNLVFISNFSSEKTDEIQRDITTKKVEAFKVVVFQKLDSIQLVEMFDMMEKIEGFILLSKLAE